MTAYIERLAAQRIIEPIMLPNDVPAPICNHHADDTTLGVKTIEDGITAFEQGVQRYCRASGARSSLSKAAGMTLGSHPHVEGLEPRTGARFIGPQDSHKHLGIPLARQGAAQDQAVQSMFIKVLRNMRYSARQWSRIDLSPMGRIYVSKQVMCSILSKKKKKKKSRCVE